MLAQISGECFSVEVEHLQPKMNPPPLFGEIELDLLETGPIHTTADIVPEVLVGR